jgi:hypothetical protein
MKKMLIVFLFLILISGAFAMDYPIRVETASGNRVTVVVRDPDTGIKIGSYSDEGFADENGLFETRIFYLLSQENAIYHVRTFSGLQLLQDKKFEDLGTEKPLLFNCVGECFASTYEPSVEEAVVEEVSENKSVEVVEVNEIVDLESFEGNNSVEEGFTGMTIFINEDGSFKWVFLIGGIALLLFIFVVVFIVRYSRKIKAKRTVADYGEKGKEIIEDVDEKELEDVEKKVKEKADEIKKIKEKKDKKMKIEQAKMKLAEEERELKELGEGGNSNNIEKTDGVNGLS